VRNGHDGGVLNQNDGGRVGRRGSMGQWEVKEAKEVKEVKEPKVLCVDEESE